MPSLLRSPMTVERVFVKDPELIYEQTLAGNNIGKLMETLRGGATNAPQAKAEQKPARTERGATVVITDLRVEGAKMRVGTGIGSSTVLVPLPPIHLTDIGKDTGGTSLKDAIAQVLTSVTGAGSRALKGAGDAATAGAKDAGQATVDAVQKGVGKTVDSVTGLFKKD